MNYYKAKIKYLLMFKQLEDVGEQIIAKHSWYSFLYAQEVLKGRFKIGEAAIAKEGYYSYHYAQNILQGRFKLGEPEIAKSMLNRHLYNIFLKDKGINFELP